MPESVSSYSPSTQGTSSGSNKSSLFIVLAAIALAVLVWFVCGSTTKSKWLVIKETKNAINLSTVTRIGLGEANRTSLQWKGYRPGARIQFWFSSERLELEFESEQKAVQTYDQITNFLTNGSASLEVSLGSVK